MKDEFNPLFGHHAFVNARLHAILSKNTRAMLNATKKDWIIGVHTSGAIFRFARWISMGHHRPPNRNRGLSIRYAGCRAHGWKAPARVFSDARPQDLPAFMAEPGVSMRVKAPAIVELLSMAKSDVLITSARSTFSHWATFLGQMPSLWYPTIGRVMNPAGLAFSGDECHGRISNRICRYDQTRDWGKTGMIQAAGVETAGATAVT